MLLKTLHVKMHIKWIIVYYNFILLAHFQYSLINARFLKQQKLNLTEFSEKALYDELDKIIKFHEADTREATSQCETCKITLSVLLPLITASPVLANQAIKYGCQFVITKKSGGNKEVCQGIAATFQYEANYILGNLALSPDQLCPLILPDCGSPSYNPFKPWNVTLPDTPKPPVDPWQLPPAGSPTLRVLHLTDIHIDPLYQEGTEAECDYPLCCRHYPSDNASVHVKSPAKPWGSIGHRCDVPERTVVKIFEHIRDNEQFDFILWTGDMTAHDVWMQSREVVLKALDRLSLLMDSFFPNKTIYGAIGNHESYPINNYAANNNDTPSRFQPKWLYSTLALQWNAFVKEEGLPSAAVESINRLSSYTVSIRPGLKLISLNTQHCAKQNFWNFLDNDDPDGVLAWLADELQDSEDSNQKVWIIGHSPPQCKVYYRWSWAYYELVNRYESTIRGQFFGHHHKDSFYLFYENGNSSSARATSVMFDPAAITNNPGQNPSYRVYTVDARHNGSWAVLDYEVTYMDMDASNQLDNGQIVTKKEYSALKTYNLTSLSPQSLNKFVKLMESDEGLSLAKLYAKFYNVSYASKDCDRKCQLSLICKIRQIRGKTKLPCSVENEKQ